VVTEVSDVADRLGLKRLALVPSPIEGAEGNREFLGHFKRFEDLRT
jgi:predicted rRNA methylase YqxC with S4 and FtsJ domains